VTRFYLQDFVNFHNTIVLHPYQQVACHRRIETTTFFARIIDCQCFSRELTFRSEDDPWPLPLIYEMEDGGVGSSTSAKKKNDGKELQLKTRQSIFRQVTMAAGFQRTFPVCEAYRESSWRYEGAGAMPAP